MSFRQYVDIVNKNKNVSIDRSTKLSLYGLFKQATEGDAPFDGPSRIWIVDYMKWSAWDENRGMSQKDAEEKYVNIVQKIHMDSQN